MKTLQESEVTRWLHNFSTCPGWNGVVEREMAKELVSHDFVFCNGYIRYIRLKHVGAGMFKVFTEASP